MQGQKAGWGLRGDTGGGMVRNVEGKGQKDGLLLNYRGRCPQVLRERGGFKEQPLEADGSERLTGDAGNLGRWFPLQVLLPCF